MFHLCKFNTAVFLVQHLNNSDDSSSNTDGHAQDRASDVTSLKINIVSAKYKTTIIYIF